MQSLALAALVAIVEPALAQSICATRKDPEPCYRQFGLQEGERTDIVVVGTIEKDRWRFSYRLPGPPAANAPVCAQGGDLTLRRGSRVEIWVGADRGIHGWKVPGLGIDATAMSGSYAPVKVETETPGAFRAEPDAKGRTSPAIRILEPDAFAAWTRKNLGRNCTF